MLKSCTKMNKLILLLILAFVFFTVPACLESGGNNPGQPNDSYVVEKAPADASFKFGVMGDTQWTYDLDDPLEQNPETVAVSFINQVNQEFINHGVEFVIQVGDLTNYGYDEAIDARAAAAQALYDEGIGFFPMRGNHEPWGNLFGDQIDNSYAIPAIQSNFPQNTGIGVNIGGATNFSSPTTTDAALPNFNSELAGISYAFDYDDGEGNSATFVIIDPWETDSASEALFSKYYAAWDLTVPYPYGYRISAQQEWISSRIDSTTRGTEHAFVFSHQPLIASNHEDSPFGFLDEQTDDQNTFYADLLANDVAYYISGHDHVHDRAMVESPDGLSSIEQLICAPQCPKFYAPDYEATEWRGQKDRRTIISSEYNNPGYYIFTVDGPIVTAEYYSDETGGWVAATRPNAWPAGADNETDLATPAFNYVLKETFSFSLNGQAFMIAQGESYSAVTDTYNGTTASLGGTNDSTSVECATCADATSNTMALTKRITTAWKDQDQFVGIASNAVMINGIHETGAATADKYILSMSVTGETLPILTRIVALNRAGEWKDASSLTQNGSHFVLGPADIAYDAGTYGTDTTTNTAWVVLDFDGTFAIRD